MPQNVSKQAEANRDGVINPQNLTNRYTENFDALNSLRNNQRRPYHLATCALRDPMVNLQLYSQIN